MNLLSRIMTALCLLAVTGCAGSQMPVIESGPRYSTAVADLADYRLAAGDKIRLVVYNEPTLSGEFSVGSNGKLPVPLIGDVDADGKTVGEVGADIQAKLADGYLRDPKVSAEVTGYRPFFILGEVTAPGQYPYATGMTAMNAVATAQGFTPRAESKVIYIRRAGTGQEQAYKLSPDLRVLPGDTIRVGERFF